MQAGQKTPRNMKSRRKISTGVYAKFKIISREPRHRNVLHGDIQHLVPRTQRVMVQSANKGIPNPRIHENPLERTYDKKMQNSFYRVHGDILDLLHKYSSTAIFIFRLRLCKNCSPYTRVYASQFLLRLARNLKISSRKYLCSRSNNI